MHKKIVTIVLALAITSVLSAQESTDKTITIGTDILPLICQGRSVCDHILANR